MRKAGELVPASMPLRYIETPLATLYSSNRQAPYRAPLPVDLYFHPSRVLGQPAGQAHSHGWHVANYAHITCMPNALVHLAPACAGRQGPSLIRMKTRRGNNLQPMHPTAPLGLPGRVIASTDHRVGREGRHLATRILAHSMAKAELDCGLHTEPPLCSLQLELSTSAHNLRAGGDIHRWTAGELMNWSCCSSEMEAAACRQRPTKAYVLQPNLPAALAKVGRANCNARWPELQLVACR